MDPVSKDRITAANSGKSGSGRRVPPIGRRFQPGQSGNPSGRPKKKPITEIYEEIFNDPKVREQVKLQIIDTMTKKGMSGVLERREAADRIEGKVAQVVDMEVTGKLTLEQVLQAKRKSGK